jgi:hypothetical protein
LTSTGSITNYAGGTVVNYGIFESAGALTNRAGGTISTFGSTITNTGDVLNEGTIDGPSFGAFLSTFSQTAGSVVNDGTVDLARVDILGGSVSGSGTWDVGTITVGPGAVVEPGSSPGTMTIHGDFVCDACTIMLEIAGDAAGQFDVIEVSGTTSFVGPSNVIFDFIDGYAPEEGDLFSFINSPSPVDFTSVLFSFAGLQDGFEFDVTAPETGGLQFTALNSGSPVPLPGTAPLLAGALLWLRGLLRRRRGPVLPATRRKFY